MASPPYGPAPLLADRKQQKYSDWVDASEEIAVNVQRVWTKMAELAKSHAKALMPSFGDCREDQCRIEALTQEIIDLLKKLMSEKRLQRLSAGDHSEDSNVKKNVQGDLDGIGDTRCKIL